MRERKKTEKKTERKKPRTRSDRTTWISVVKKKSTAEGMARRVIVMSPRCLESQGCQFDPTVSISPLLFLGAYSPVALYD